MSKAAWSGTRITLRQVSPEANLIFDFIVALYFSCNGDWDRLASRAGLDFHDLQLFLDYAATFLSNLGNYYGSGDQKFVPSIAREKLARLAARASPHLVTLWEQICDPMFQKPPLSLGPPGRPMQSAYYSGYEDGAPSFREDAALASRIMQELSIFPENTRLRRARLSAGTEVLSIMQASVAEARTLYNDISDTVRSDKTIEIVTGDHTNELWTSPASRVRVAYFFWIPFGPNFQ
ncbi:hypothetical protein BDV10DRAFT_176954 [Aspergillus recurvatus]